MEMLTYRIPKQFLLDHMSRALIERDPVVKILSKHFVVSLTKAEYDELLDDARFYVDMGVAEFGWEYAWLVSSARATVAALTK